MVAVLPRVFLPHFFLSLILPLLSFFFAEYRTYLKLSLLSIAGVPGEKP